MSEEEIGNEPKDVEEVHYIKETLQVRKVVRKLNEDNVWEMVFFYLAINDEPFHITLYCKDGDPSVCAHDSLPIKFASNSLFFHCKREYQDGYIWLKCTVCDHWFHDDCDHM